MYVYMRSTGAVYCSMYAADIELYSACPTGLLAAVPYLDRIVHKCIYIHKVTAYAANMFQ